MKILILEDDDSRIKFFIERFCDHTLKVIENSKDAISYLKTDVFDYIFLDNDLGEGNGEGLDVAKFLRENPGNINNLAQVIIHSWNVPATIRMVDNIPDAVVAPFNTEKFLNLNIDIWKLMIILC